MPPGYTDEGLRAAIAIRRDHPKTGVLVFSHYIETRYAADLLGAASGRGAAGVGYLLKDRVADVGEFVEALSRVAAGGTALDPEVVTQLLGASRRTDGLGSITARERDVLALMAEGRSNGAIAAILVVSERAVEKHVGLPHRTADLARGPRPAAVTISNRSSGKQAPCRFGAHENCVEHRHIRSQISLFCVSSGLPQLVAGTQAPMRQWPRRRLRRGR